MIPKIITCIAITIAALMSAFTATAQQHIEGVIARHEKDPKITVTYTERRDPKTHKLTKQSTILNGNSKKDADALWRAFDADRNYSTMISKTRDQSFIIKFLTNDIMSTYVLSISGTNWTLVVTKRPAEEDDYDTSCNGLNVDSLENLNSLTALNDLDVFKNLDLSFIESLDRLDVVGLNCLESPAVIEGLNKFKEYFDKNVDKDKIEAAAKSLAGNMTINILKTIDNTFAKSKPNSTSTSTSTTSDGRTVTTIKNSDGKTIATVYSI